MPAASQCQVSTDHIVTAIFHALTYGRKCICCSSPEAKVKIKQLKINNTIQVGILKRAVYHVKVSECLMT